MFCVLFTLGTRTLYIEDIYSFRTDWHSCVLIPCTVWQSLANVSFRQRTRTLLRDGFLFSSVHVRLVCLFLHIMEYQTKLFNLFSTRLSFPTFTARLPFCLSHSDQCRFLPSGYHNVVTAGSRLFVLAVSSSSAKYKLIHDDEGVDRYERY